MLELYYAAASAVSLGIAVALARDWMSIRFQMRVRDRIGGLPDALPVARMGRLGGARIARTQGSGVSVFR